MNNIAFEYFDAISRRDRKKVDEITLNLLEKYNKKISEATVANMFEAPFVAVVLKMCAENYYNALPPMGKSLSDEVYKNVVCVSVIEKVHKEGGNNE